MADRCRTGFPACRGSRPSTNQGTNKRMGTADGRPRNGRWTVDRGRWWGRFLASARGCRDEGVSKGDKGVRGSGRGRRPQVQRDSVRDARGGPYPLGCSVWQLHAVAAFSYLLVGRGETRGSEKQIRAPLWGEGSAQMRPPWASMIARARYNPRPAPFVLRMAASER